jgi:hypothetical protein
MNCSTLSSMAKNRRGSGKGLGGVSYKEGCQLDKRFDFVRTSIEDHLEVHIMSVVSI